MRSAVLWLFVLAGAVALSSGCVVVGAFQAPQVKYELEPANPLLISQDEGQKIRVLLVAPPGDKRIREQDLVYLSEELAKTNRFKVLSPARFLQESGRANISLMTSDERTTLVQRVGASAGADAVLFLAGEELRQLLGEGFLRAQIGQVALGTKLRLQAISAKSGKVIWSQTESATISAGIKSGSGHDDRLMREMITPLVKSFLASF